MGDSDDNGSMDEGPEVKNLGSTTNCITQVLDEEGELLIMFDRQFDRFPPMPSPLALTRPASLPPLACVSAGNLASLGGFPPASARRPSPPLKTASANSGGMATLEEAQGEGRTCKGEKPVFS